MSNDFQYINDIVVSKQNAIKKEEEDSKKSQEENENEFAKLLISFLNSYVVQAVEMAIKNKDGKSQIKLDAETVITSHSVPNDVKRYNYVKYRVIPKVRNHFADKLPTLRIDIDIMGNGGIFISKALFCINVNINK